jgi:coenzyme F420-reducing hydrogenase beta subunit
MTNSLLLSQSSDAHKSVGYMWGEGSVFAETTFVRTERIKKYLKGATQQATISVSNYQL